MAPIVGCAARVTINVMHASAQARHSQHHRPQQKETDRTCKIVTFYEDFADAIRAHRMFDCVARNFSGNAPVRATSWSFSLLGNPELNSIIFGDVAFADVIIVAMKGDREVPQRIAMWVENCMQGKPEIKPVVVALHDEESESDATADSFCLSLMRLANRRDATFMSSADLAPRLNRETPGALIRERQESLDSALETARYPASESLRWWGIND